MPGLIPDGAFETGYPAEPSRRSRFTSFLLRYHIEFAMDAPPIRRPVSPVDLGFYVTPMAGRLRVAGLVELGGLSAPLNPLRLRISNAASGNCSLTSDADC